MTGAGIVDEEHVQIMDIHGSIYVLPQFCWKKQMTPLLKGTELELEALPVF